MIAGLVIGIVVTCFVFAFVLTVCAGARAREEWELSDELSIHEELRLISSEAPAIATWINGDGNDEAA